ncbi:hypothetical protein L6164_003761 [Bauhinia variegata]|uniref:Uncharacterized protein n=1 Tax=Bauhinia variegata TaxID=167791 RepID=A0ACB9Q1T9_BAUVA|nr:hypothetical protein L6164_003761 [Bauhinia variegata]
MKKTFPNRTSSRATRRKDDKHTDTTDDIAQWIHLLRLFASTLKALFFHSPSASNPSMADKNFPVLPVLVLGPPTCFSALQPQYSHKFHFLTPTPPRLPLPQFITAHHHQPSLIQAILCSAGYSLTSDVLRLFPSLGIIVTTSAGTDHIDMSECRRRGIQVAGAENLFAEDVADMAVGLLIDVTRKISAGDRYLRNRVGYETSDFPLGSKV